MKVFKGLNNLHFFMERRIFVQIEEVCERFEIPIDILKCYENWNFLNAEKLSGKWDYDKKDIELLSTITTLYDVGFSLNEIEEYMRLSLSECDNSDKLVKILNEKRDNALDEIHHKQIQLDTLDYLRFELSKIKK